MKKLFFTIVLTGFILTMNSCKTCCTPKGLINVDQASNLESNYLSKRQQILNGSTEYSEDTREFWWSIDELESYICYAKEQANKQGKKVNGFRIYLGAYPLDISTDQVGQNTIFMVPTELKTDDGTKSLIINKSKLIESSNSNENIQGICPLDYAGAGNPPKAYN